MTRLTVVDSGGANLASVLFALDRIGVKGELTADPDVISNSPKILLPGVGMAGTAMAGLRQKELVQCLQAYKQPALGICLGMQLLFEHSEEGDVPCLGVLPGTVRRIALQPGHPVPHMGWNKVRATGECALLDGEAFFYFVHSYAAPLGDTVRGVADYGIVIPAVVQRDNWFGAQFHPERSGEAGERLLERFVRL